jgi:predicted enzyme related to lactoylglutathione lyase
VTIDCHDPERLAAFWASVFGTAEEWRGGDPVQYVDLAGTDGSPVLRFQRVPEPKTVKDRIHLDLRVDDIDEACARIVGLGGVRAQQGDVREYDVVFRVMLDPEGNEFCLVSDA